MTGDPSQIVERLYDCRCNNARYAEPCDRCEYPGECAFAAERARTTELREALTRLQMGPDTLTQAGLRIVLAALYPQPEKEEARCLGGGVVFEPRSGRASKRVPCPGCPDCEKEACKTCGGNGLLDTGHFTAGPCPDCTPGETDR